ncbi:MAG: cytochrome c oxidase subunit II [Candidatus Eremiobacteraeota bacterium]|nr:cytochrome c oxidase subunit II [Candidatus Eremiobacteraeota bacterium]
MTLVLAALSVLAIWGMLAVDYTRFLPEGAAPSAQVDALTKFLSASSAALFIFVIGYLIYFSLAFRLRKSDLPDAIGIQIHDNTKLELWWTIIPTIFVVIMAIFSVQIWYGIQVQPNNGMVVEALGHQWFYTFRYPQVHGEVPNEMHLAVGVPITLHVTSYDVIHSFWVPAFRLKADMVPGLINTLRFTPNRVGTYPIICTEFCGTLHGEMDKQTVVVESKAKFDAWYAAIQKKNAHVSDKIASVSTGSVNLSGGVVAAGATTFSAKCSACHAVGPFSQKIVGPGLKGVLHDPAHPNLVDGKPATEANVAAIIQNGFHGAMGTMPTMQANGLTDKDIANLVAYLDTLK